MRVRRLRGRWKREDMSTCMQGLLQWGRCSTAGSRCTVAGLRN